MKCSGALVDKEHVLTTKSCVNGLKYSTNYLWEVRLGDYRAKRRDFGEKKLKIKSVIYPSSTSGANDIALIHLKIPSGNRYQSRVIKPIKISGSDSLSSTAGLSIWGSWARVHALHITLGNQKVCKNVFTSFNQSNDICSLPASFSYVERRTYRFSGSPLVQYRDKKPELIGLLTNIEKVNKPSRESRFAKYIRPSQFLPWLNKYLNNNVA